MSNVDHNLGDEDKIYFILYLTINMEHYPEHRGHLVSVRVCVCVCGSMCMCVYVYVVKISYNMIITYLYIPI